MIAMIAAGLALLTALAPALLEATPDQRPALEKCRLNANTAGDLDLSVVVPFYNPGDLLRPNLLNLVEALRCAGASFEVIAVSDGCTDGSPASIADLEPTVIRCLSLPRNAGKGAALRLGLAEGRGRYLGFIDADGDLDPAHWEPFLGLVKLYRPDVVMGSKLHTLSDIDASQSSIRRLASWGYQTLVRVLFPSLPVRDTQVGIKVFRRELLMDVLPRTIEQRFVFDLELLVVARRLGYRRIMTAPITMRRNGVSTLRPRAVWVMFADTVKLACRLHLRHSYDTVHVDRAATSEFLGQDPAQLWGLPASMPAAMSPATVS
jgi:glycosyltransferase involved in cell wall biosynthesis